MDAKLQREHMIAATRIHFKLYKKNIDVLCDNHPFLMSLVLGEFQPSPIGKEVAYPRCGFQPTPTVMAHPTYRALLKHAPAGACLQCFKKQEQLDKCVGHNKAIRDLLIIQLKHPATAIVSKITHVFDLGLICHFYFRVHAAGCLNTNAAW